MNRTSVPNSAGVAPSDVNKLVGAPLKSKLKPEFVRLVGGVLVNSRSDGNELEPGEMLPSELLLELDGARGDNVRRPLTLSESLF